MAAADILWIKTAMAFVIIMPYGEPDVEQAEAEEADRDAADFKQQDNKERLYR